MKLGKSRIHLLILLFAVSSLLVHFPSEAFADLGDIIAVKSQSEGNHFEFPGTTELSRYGTCSICSSLVQVDSDTYAYAYNGPNKKGHIQTFSISSDGSSIAAVDNVKHDQIQTTQNSLVKGEGDLFVLSYDGDGADNWISTFTIDSDGEITPILIRNHEEFESASANLEHDTTNLRGSSLVHLDSDTYVLAFDGPGNDGHIKTFTIPSDGSSITEVDDLEYDTMHAEHNSLVKVDSDTLALAYRGYDAVNKNYWGVISTFNIAANGNISERASIEHDDESAYYNSLVKVDSDTYALAYAGSDQESGFIKTFTIPSDGSSITPVDSFEHDTNAVKWNSLVNVHSGIYALSYSVESGDYSDGFLSTFIIDGDGDIDAVKTQSQGNNLMHELVNARENILVAVDSDTVVLAYKGGQGTSIHRTSLSTFCIGSGPTICNEIMTASGSDCYDCEAPKLTKVEVHITSNTSEDIVDDNSPQISETRDYVWNFEQDTPYPMFGDIVTPIVADPGDEVQIILELTDNRTLKRIADSGTYTNFLHKPNDMNNFYANNFDESSKVSTTYYEWHQTGDDLVYDYDNTVEWSPADVTIEESGELDNRDCCNLDDLAGTFTISFKMKFLQPMQTTDVWVQAIDRSGNFFKVALPLTLKVTGNEPLVFASKVNQKVLGFYDESILNEIVSDWTGSQQDVSELATVLGIADEQLPPWVTNLTVWVSEDKITLADMIVSIEHFINN